MTTTSTTPDGEAALALLNGPGRVAAEAAARLISDDGPPRPENAEYDRALVEMTIDLAGLSMERHRSAVEDHLRALARS
jgi:hypothetical protein